MLDKRERIYYKLTRCERLLDLYGECLQQEPLYIPKPRKFRNDKYHVMSTSEYACIQKFELQRLQSECEILKIRRDNFSDNLSNLDQEIDDFVKIQPFSQKVKEMA